LINFFNNRKAFSKVLIAVIVVIAVLASAGVYYFASQNTPSTGPDATPTPTPFASPTATPNPTSTPTPTATPTSPPNIGGASSLQYTVTVTEGGTVQQVYTYSGKNIGTNQFKMRVAFTDEPSEESGIVVNEALEKVWSYSDGTWEDMSVAYEAQLSIWKPAWQNYVNSLSAWSGIGDYTYTQEGVTVRIHDITVNPSLPDSMFEPA